jgi:hypothetical protein
MGVDAMVPVLESLSRVVLVTLTELDRGVPWLLGEGPEPGRMAI